MNWLNDLIEKIIARQPTGEIIVESGISPSGSYHMGYLREIILCDAVVLELKRRGRQARHVHFVDDLDGFRKVPANLPDNYQQYLGKPLCDMPAPDGSGQTYADYCLQDFLNNIQRLGVSMDVIRAHEKYREGFFAEAIEQTLEKIGQVREILEDVSGRKLDPNWSPIQVNEGGYLKKRPFISIDTKNKIIKYLDKEDNEQATSYVSGEVKLDWRLDWPARWSLLDVSAEPFGRDHATKGGSYDTGKELVRKIFGGEPPVPIPYNFVNRAGETKKMSASKGNGILINEVINVLPAEISRFFILRSSAEKALFFDPENGVTRLVDEFAELLSKTERSESEDQLLYLCLNNIKNTTISRVPFSHLVASYQAALKDEEKTLEIIKRTEYKEVVEQEAHKIIDELHYIDQWLKNWAPEDVKFELQAQINPGEFSEEEKDYFAKLAEKIEIGPKDADGEWFHKAIYDFKDSINIPPKNLFISLYRLIIGKDSGPRAGWFLSILPREWLLARLKLEK